MKFVVILPKMLYASGPSMPTDHGVFGVNAPTRARALDWAQNRDLGAVVCNAYEDDLQRFKTWTEIDP